MTHDTAVHDLVLIHSTGQSAAGWDRVVAALAERGHDAYAVELPADRPELGAAAYGEIVRDQAGAVERPVVVAHSGSGVLLPAAASALDARRQVWLAAWVPDPGGAGFAEDAEANLDDAFDPGWIDKDPSTDDEVAGRFLYHDCDAETRVWALRTRRRFVPTAAFEEHVELAPEIPSTYIVARYDRTIRPEWQRQMARERLGVEPLELPTGHCPNVSRPDLLADLLHDVAVR